MTRKASDADFENAIQMYVEGAGVEACCARWHTSYKRLADELKARGLFRDKTTRYELASKKVSATRARQRGLPTATIVRRYRTGESVNALAFAYGITRRTIGIELRHGGVARLRSQTEANQLRAAQTSPAEHARRAEAAHAAVRGVKQSFEHRCAIAATRETRPSNVSAAEQMLAGWLMERGLGITPQKAIGPYNVDVGVCPIAVEVFGGNWHAQKAIHPKRTRYILDAGWHLIFVWTLDGDTALLPTAADYIVARLEAVRRDPPTVGQYWVIRGDGQEFLSGSADSDHIALVPPGSSHMRSRSTYLSAGD